MNTGRSLYKHVQRVYYPEKCHPVEKSAATALSQRLNLSLPESGSYTETGLLVSLASRDLPEIPERMDTIHPWIYVKINSTGDGVVLSSEPALLYAIVHADYILTPNQQKQVPNGLMLYPGFNWNRPLFDSCLNQVARHARGFAIESYIEQLARNGFTHLEVNGLAMHLAYEARVAGEYYSQFYAYGPGFMQFVDSTLTRGLYDPSLLQANLQRMKKIAEIGRSYGLKPGMFCFEPRTLPDRFFQQYPTLRGARVDHPLRSHMPRYTLAQDHPVTRAHYRELIENLMHEIPDLAYISIWSNDSGSGFEHTSSLYAGRNGGPYIIREWKTHAEIAMAAGESVVRWLRLVRDTAAETNPNIEVSLRIESFRAEHETILAGMGNGLTIETPSLLVHGYDLPYVHPNLPKNKGIAGTMFHLDMDSREAETLVTYREKGIEPIIHYAPSSTFNMEPLLGIPYPHMLFQKLQSLHETSVQRVSAIGGLLHMDKTPYWPNPHVIRAFQLNPQLQLEDFLHHLANDWVGPSYAKALIHAWQLIEDAFSHMPYLPLFSNFGFVWYRLWIRPFVPDIEAIPQKERAYYERFMVTMPNNPNMNDLGKDVLFELITESSGAYMAHAFDAHVEPGLNHALQFIHQQMDQVQTPEHHVFSDLYTRVEAVKIWAITLRNLCSWVKNVYGYLRVQTRQEKEMYQRDLQATIDKDLTNTKDLLNLWQTSQVEFMLISELGETSYIYGTNFGDSLEKKIELTEKYRHYPPYIDKDIIWRIPPNMAAFNR